MRRDFHFHVIYVLLRAAGMKYDIAHKVAYASEHVDNSKEEDIISFKNGGRTRSIRSAHKMLSRRMYTDKTGMAIYMPFHFFPCCEGSSFFEKIECIPNSQGIRDLKQELVTHLDQPYGPHLLGVALHVIADTYAHKNFNALNDKHNESRHMNVINHKVLDFIYSRRPRFLPPFGHLQVLTCPDEPACVWSYENHLGESVPRNNLDLFMVATRDIFDFITDDVFNHRREWFDIRQRVTYETIRGKVYNMLNLNMSHTNRLNEWERMWELNYFDYEKPIYDEEKWLDDGIETTGVWKFKRYYRKEGYGSSDWKLFQDALSHHDFYCRHKIFPKYDIYV